MPPPPLFDVWDAHVGAGGEAPLYETQLVSSGVTATVHSATAVELSGGRLRAFWYGGSREGAKDVRIYTSLFEPSSGRWGREVVAVSRERASRDTHRYIKKLGNPVVARDGDGRLWLFYVSVSLGGWSGSAINVRRSEDEGATWGPSRRLVTSPFLNVSTLVRGPAVSFRDGSLGLPVYHELFGKFSELLRVDPERRVLGKMRLTWGRSSLQPVIVPTSERSAVAFLRASGRSPRRILSVKTLDGGRHWSGVAPTDLPNPDAGIAVVAAGSNRFLVAFNDSETGRENLTLALSPDAGESWQRFHRLAPPELVGDTPPRFAYPWLLQATDGVFHLFYTWDRRQIVHVRFNRAWIRQQLS